MTRTSERSLRVLEWLCSRLDARRYEVTRRELIPGGFLQEHVLHGTAPDGSAVAMPACLVVTVADGRITRINEYLDPAGHQRPAGLNRAGRDRPRSRPPLRRPAGVRGRRRLVAQLPRPRPPQRRGRRRAGRRRGEARATWWRWPCRRSPTTPCSTRRWPSSARSRPGLNPRSTPAERAAVLAVAAPDLVVATPDLADGVPAALAVVEIATGHRRAEAILAGLREGHHGQVPLRPRPGPRPAGGHRLHLGHHGHARGAMFGERELAAVTAADVGDRRDGGGPMLSGTQFAHVGFMTKLPWYLRVGSTLHLLDRWRAPTCCASSPTSTWPASAAWPPSWPCCCACPTSTTTTSPRSRPS